MKIQDKVKEIVNIFGEDIDKYLGLTSLGTILNLLEDGINELKDEDISKKLKELINLIGDKREEILDKEIK